MSGEVCWAPKVLQLPPQVWQGHISRTLSKEADEWSTQNEGELWRQSWRLAKFCDCAQEDLDVRD